MAIRLKNLERIAKNYTEQTYLYKDLTLDLTQTALAAPGFRIPVPGADIKASFDMQAIANSLQNLFNTSPGQRFLFPEYGLNLNRFLFSSITEANGNVIGSKITAAVSTWEPRVLIKDILIVPEPDKNQYTINIILDIPSLNTRTTYNAILNVQKQTFIVLPPSNTNK